MNTGSPAFVLGMFETGLGVARSLGQQGIEVYGIDFKKDVGCYSRYVRALICPHPIDNQEEFVSFLVGMAKKVKEKPVLFITSDVFLQAISANRASLQPFLSFNLPSGELLARVSDKFEQYMLAKAAGNAVPETYLLTGPDHLDETAKKLPFPVLIKALDVNSWRKNVSGSVKGFVAKNTVEVSSICRPILEKQVPLVIQEIIGGPDTSHFKYCAYYSPEGKIICEFTLRKIRQNPIHFGVGAVVESIAYDELVQTGRRLFQSIGYTGVGSAEFKADAKDGRLKLIEINPRYWQQNYLATACGMNFPLLDYQTMTGQATPEMNSFKPGIKWVNRYLDFNSFIGYHREKSITFLQWRKSLKGKKVYSDFSWDDMLPAGYEFRFGLRILRLPGFLFKRIFQHGR